jgi:hypothetical protein
LQQPTLLQRRLSFSDPLLNSVLRKVSETDDRSDNMSIAHILNSRLTSGAFFSETGAKTVS